MILYIIRPCTNDKNYFNELLTIYYFNTCDHLLSYCISRNILFVCLFEKCITTKLFNIHYILFQFFSSTFLL